MEYLAKNKVSQLCLVTSKLNFRTFAYIIRALQHANLCTHLTFNRALALTYKTYVWYDSTIWSMKNLIAFMITTFCLQLKSSLLKIVSKEQKGTMIIKSAAK